jgi:LemA protein
MRGLVIGLLVLVVGGGIWAVSTRNGLVEKEEQVRVAWSQVQNVYQRRMDLIPNLVETVKGAANFEQETYTQVAEARAKAGQIQISDQLLNDPQAFARFEQAQQALGSSLSRLLVAVERYPDLKANANFRDLQAQLEGAENRIAVERKRFNDVVGTYNVAVRRFPGNVAAGLFGFESRPYFQAVAGAEEAPKVKF